MPHGHLMYLDDVLNAGGSGVVPAQKQQALREGWACLRLQLGQCQLFQPGLQLSEDSSSARPLVDLWFCLRWSQVLCLTLDIR